MNKREIMRLFACVWIPENIRKEIKTLQKEMLNLPMKAKFVEIENLHLTVTFLGEKNNIETTILKTKLDATVKNIERFKVKIAGLKTIPNENYIRVLGIRVGDGDKITNLIKTVGSEIGGKFYLEQKITLCRVKQVTDKHRVKEFIKENANIKIGEFFVERVSLVKSILTGGGPIYETIHDSYLK